MVKVVAGPGPHGIKITGENGEAISGVVAIDWHARVDEPCRLELVLWSGGAEIEGEAKFMVLSPGADRPKSVDKIIFADGTEWKAP